MSMSMNMKKNFSIYIFGLFIFIGIHVKAQDTPLVSETNTNSVQNNADTIPIINLEDINLDKIPDLRTQFEKQNNTYSAPTQPTEKLLRFLKKDELQLSEEALYWAHYVRDASTIFDSNLTFKDTVLVSPIFMPIFKGNILPKDLSFDKKDYFDSEYKPAPLYQFPPLFQKEKEKMEIENNVMQFVENNYPNYFKYSLRDLPQEKIQTNTIKKKTFEDVVLKVESDANLADVSSPQKFIPERKYWISHFESSLQFAQNYISPNWHKGGTSNLNLYNREYITYNYNKDKIQFTNELEFKVRFYNAPKDTLHDYKIGDDVLRLHSNFGYKAFNKWYYSFDANFQTQVFNNYQENTMTKQASFLSPMSVNIGIGMKYDLNKSFKKRHKNVVLAINLAPLSFTYMYSLDKDIDLGRHGFKKNEETGEFENHLSQFGSTVNATMTFNFSRTVSWYSRFYYFTSYDRILGEFENILTMAISRYFSTTINLNLRYDDSVTKNPEFERYLQINELLSFGFNYKW